MKLPALTQSYATIKDFVQSHFYEDNPACACTSKMLHKPSICGIQSHTQASLCMTNKLFIIAFSLNVVRQNV